MEEEFENIISLINNAKSLGRGIVFTQMAYSRNIQKLKNLGYYVTCYAIGAVYYDTMITW